MASTRRRIALIAPPWYPVPPDGYGGTELVVGLLTKELRAQGHEVELFAAEGSALASRQLAGRHWDTALGRSEEHVRDLTYASRVLNLIDRLRPFDVIHDHTGGGALLGLAIKPPAPVVHTVHLALKEPVRTFLESLAPDRVRLIAISEAQRQSVAHLPWTATVHNAVDLAALRVGQPERKDPYLLSLARICASKGQHLAIEAARRAGRRLLLAGKIEATPQGFEYYERQIAPAVDGDRVTYLGNVSGEEKTRLLARASALLAPLQWDEPFGLYMAEAMASGTPVIAFPRGAAPELITPGKTGFLVPDVEEMVGAVAQADHVDREQCAAYARAQFDPRRMADGYLQVYERAIAEWATPTSITVSATDPAITRLRGANRRRSQLSLGKSEVARK